MNQHTKPLTGTYKLDTHSGNFQKARALKMSRTKELGEAWFGCQAELKHLKAILKLKEYIQRVYSKPQKKRNEETTKRAKESR